MAPMPERTPPRGVPRWLWPPPGATVRRVVVRERRPEGGPVAYAVTEGPEPEHLHLRALQWLLLEHPRAPLPGREGQVLLEIARTAMAGGRVGHAYAIDGGPLGAPSGDVARGILWRYVHTQVSAVE
jgi:hypothetical protein